MEPIKIMPKSDWNLSRKTINDFAASLEELGGNENGK